MEFWTVATQYFSAKLMTDRLKRPQQEQL
jgi:hypothetical protein